MTLKKGDMVGQQYTAKQRAFMAAQYYKRSGTRDFMPLIIQDFLVKFPGAIPEVAAGGSCEFGGADR